MSRLGSWFRGSTPRASAHPSPSTSQTELQAAEVAQIKDAMTSAAKIMNDDIAGAEVDLRKGSSPFHLLGLGITTFMRSILGFEKDIMAEASTRLNECETAAWNAMKKAQRDAATHGASDRIHPPGSEYALVHAEAQMMGAVVAVLHESLTEGLKGFYKLRKAFVTLDGLMEAETAYLKQKGILANDSNASLPPMQRKEAADVDHDDEDLEFVEAPEHLSGDQTPAQYEGHLATEAGEAAKELAELSLDEKKEKSPVSASKPGPEDDVFTDPIDAFVHSGVNMCFGVLLLIISMVPPAFSRLLSVIGFRGDRERGVKMMWQSTRFDNINGAVSGLVLLAYYNGLLGFADILPSEEEVEQGALVGYPRRRCAELLATMRSRYPDSRLWRLEEARALSNSRDLRGAIEILARNTDSKMRQVTALNSFEFSLDTMFISDYPRMRDNFLRCIELNDWSHSLYYFMAGCAELENYRAAFHSEKRDATQMGLHKKKAEELIRHAPTVGGKKRFMARPLPFEQYVAAKVEKWESRASELGLELADAVGVSPCQEMVYLWNGPKKMGTLDLEVAEKTLDWNRLTAPPEAKAKIVADKDEECVRSVCLAAVLRTLGRTEEATQLAQGVLAVDRYVWLVRRRLAAGLTHAIQTAAQKAGLGLGTAVGQLRNGRRRLGRRAETRQRGGPAQEGRGMPCMAGQGGEMGPLPAGRACWHARADGHGHAALVQAGAWLGRALGVRIETVVFAASLSVRAMPMSGRPLGGGEDAEGLGRGRGRSLDLSFRST